MVDAEKPLIFHTRLLAKTFHIFSGMAGAVSIGNAVPGKFREGFDLARSMGVIRLRVKDPVSRAEPEFE